MPKSTRRIWPLFRSERIVLAVLRLVTLVVEHCLK